MHYKKYSNLQRMRGGYIMYSELDFLDMELVDAPMYFSYLHRAVCKAINDIEHCNYGMALDSLKMAQASSRNMYLAQKGPDR